MIIYKFLIVLLRATIYYKILVKLLILVKNSKIAEKITE